MALRTQGFLNLKSFVQLAKRLSITKNLFEKADFKPNDSSFTNQLSSEFKWQPNIDEEPYWESDLLWPN